MRKGIVLLLFSFALSYASAQDIATCDSEMFRVVVEKLVSKGNLAYKISDRDGIKEAADTIESYLTKRKRAGRLKEEDSLEYTADRYKLLGNYYYENSFSDEKSTAVAHEYYRRAMDIYMGHPIFENDLDKIPIIHRELAQLYYKEKNYKEALTHTRKAYEAFNKAVSLDVVGSDDTDFLDLQTQMALCLARMGEYKEAVSMIDKLIKAYSPTDVIYGEALRKKAKILMLQEEGGAKTDRTKALECYRMFFGLKKKDALAHFMEMTSKQREQYWMSIRPFVTDCYRLEDADAGFLYNVTLFAKGLLLQLDSVGGGRQNIHATWQMIQDKLKPDACAIEFIQYEKYGQQQMGALVLKKTGTPVFIAMPKPDDVMNYEIGPRSVKERLYDTHGERKDALYKDSTGIFRFIWHKSLISVMDNVKKVYFAPDGYIHQIAIEYMLPAEMSRVEMHRLSSTRCFMQRELSVGGEKALVIGGVDYLHADNVVEGDNDHTAYQNLKGCVGFKYLKGSLSEAEQIIALRHHTGDSLIISSQATENTFRKICGEYPIIHLSTHGTFTAASVPQGTDLKSCQADESLSQSAVALAGLQSALNNPDFDPENQEGILSAKEISSLNMNNVELVVLSCCETALGYVTADGVYGIQRGFKNAGVNAIICTLWDIWDVAATFFMTNFHRHLAGGLSIYQAFNKARDDMKDYSGEASTMTPELTAGSHDFSNPSDRNVFILIDAIE